MVLNRLQGFGMQCILNGLSWSEWHPMARNGAGVGVGMLRGAGDFLACFVLDFDDSSRFHHRKIPFVLESVGRRRLFWTYENFKLLEPMQ